jgi:hypothetical protein
MLPFDINSVVFHFDDFNYGRRSQPYFFLAIATRLFFFIAYNKMKKYDNQCYDIFQYIFTDNHHKSIIKKKCQGAGWENLIA